MSTSPLSEADILARSAATLAQANARTAARLAAMTPVEHTRHAAVLAALPDRLTRWVCSEPDDHGRQQAWVLPA